MALMLDPQHHHHVRPFDGRIDIHMRIPFALPLRRTAEYTLSAQQFHRLT